MSLRVVLPLTAPLTSYRVESFGPAQVFQRLVGEKDMTAFVADRA